MMLGNITHRQFTPTAAQKTAHIKQNKTTNHKKDIAFGANDFNIWFELGSVIAGSFATANLSSGIKKLAKYIINKPEAPQKLQIPEQKLTIPEVVREIPQIVKKIK